MSKRVRKTREESQRKQWLPKEDQRILEGGNLKLIAIDLGRTHAAVKKRRSQLLKKKREK